MRALFVASIHSVLDGAARESRGIETSWWIFFWVCLAVYGLVLLALAMGLRRSSRGGTDYGDHYRRSRPVIAAAAGLTAVVLLGFLVLSVVTEREVLAGEPGAMRMEVIGHRWWWEVRYHGAEIWQSVDTANEIHLPAGVPVQIDLQSRDVIHSFWVPSLHGKMDLVPGRTNAIVMRAERPGVYRGQCAEFCGIQHARMGLLVIVHERDEFEQWLAAQRLPGAEPVTAAQEKGREVFLTRQCAVCHTIRGTGAFGRVAPDLTHLASRRTLAAATIPNTRGHLAGWIADPQAIKPGNLMPPSGLPSDELTALVAYLESLR